jgi:hypothetical protein
MTVSVSVPEMWAETNDESFFPYSLTRRWMVSGDGIFEPSPADAASRYNSVVARSMALAEISS